MRRENHVCEKPAGGSERVFACVGIEGGPQPGEACAIVPKNVESAGGGSAIEKAQAQAGQQGVCRTHQPALLGHGDGGLGRAETV